MILLQLIQVQSSQRVHLLSNLADDLSARWSLSDHLSTVPSGLADTLLASYYLSGNLGTVLSDLADDSQVVLLRCISQLPSSSLSLTASDTVPTGKLLSCWWATDGLPIAAATPPSPPELRPMGGSSQALLVCARRYTNTLMSTSSGVSTVVEDGSQSCCRWQPVSKAEKIEGSSVENGQVLVH